MRGLLTAMVTSALIATTAGAVIVSGGGTKRRDCWAGFEVTNDRIVYSGQTRVIASAVERECVFSVKACVSLPVPRPCKRKRLSLLEAEVPLQGITLPPPPTFGRRFACGDAVEIVVATGRDGRSRGRESLRIVGRTKKGKSDSDRPRLYCEPDPNPPPPACSGPSVNPQGGPDRFVFTVGTTGTDLDLGWTGNSHNFAVVPGGKIDACLTGCNGTTDTICDVSGPANGDTFGPPQPLFASNVPICLVNRWRDPIGGTVDEASGAVSLDVALAADVYLTDQNSVCPQCRNGKCDGGVRANQSCTVEATVPVFVSPTRTDSYELSSECVPSNLTATLDIDVLPLTSSAAGSFLGPTPCTRQPGEPIGVPVKPDDCGVPGCQAQCTGLACVEEVPDPTNPGSMICKDAKGGLSQLCCNANSTRPCFPLADGGQLARSGFTTPPTPSTYPKTQETALAATFCVPATGTNTIDSVIGLPGPAAVLLNGIGEWSKTP